ncbi:sensor histidine kinase [Trebonia kvetii]|uniref:histidine kinase n=1 Tax=Trebonia kvetii TaxID=2480626 RepID=A0A6P2C5P8_9ACTN|nr:histidine kinase [Trebonia kvetii]TVZ04833.1 sensor histidine kinase [Trebonia kvetii]
MTGRIRRLLAFFGRAEAREPEPSGWALAFDAAVAVGAAVGAVYEMAERSLTQAVIKPGPGAIELVSPFGARMLVPVKMLLPPPGTHASAVMILAAAMTALPLAGRRLYPITAWLAIIAAILIVHAAYVPPVALGTAVYAAYSAITHSKYRNLAIAVVAVATIAVAAALGNTLPRFPGRLTAIFAILPAAAAGLGIRVLRRRLADSTARLDRADAEARAATERALTAERSRIAAELHDVVTHNVSVMIVQAGAARKIMASSQAEAEDALLAVEATGREAMTELRNLLGLLSPAADGADAIDSPVAGAHVAGSPVAGSRAASPLRPGAASSAAPAPAALRPQPRLGELDALIGRVSAAGLAVTLSVSGEPRPIPPGEDLAAYRVMQEGLTNVLRHAGAATATVTVDWGENLSITVADDGRGAAVDGAAPGAVPGRGLLGLRERLALYGGELTAGPRPAGGWQVRAVLPLAGIPVAGQ